MSSSNSCFLTCIQISQEAGQGLVFPSLSHFPQFVVIHTVKGFGIVNKAEVDVFLELSCFFDAPADVGNLISGSSAFSKSSLNIWKFTIILRQPITSTWMKSCVCVHSMFHSGQLQARLGIYKCYVCGWQTKVLRSFISIYIGQSVRCQGIQHKTVLTPLKDTISGWSPLWPPLTSGALHNGINLNFTS